MHATVYGNPLTTASGGPVVVSPDGAIIYDSFVADTNGIYQLVVDEIDSATMTLRRGFEVPESADRIGECAVPSLSSNTLYLACEKERFGQSPIGAIPLIDLTDFTLAATQFLNYIPQGIAATPDGTKVLVTGSTDSTQVFDGATRAYTNSISGGIQAGIVMVPQ